MFKHNEKVTCEIYGTKITDARISIDSNGDPFICQNERDGNDAENKLGYKYSWALGKDLTEYGITNLRSAIKSFDNPQEGDEYKDSGGFSRWVLGVCGRGILISEPRNKNRFGSVLMKEELINIGYTIVQDEPEPKPEEIIEVDGNKYKLIK